MGEYQYKATTSHLNEILNIEYQEVGPIEIAIGNHQSTIDSCLKQGYTLLTPNHITAKYETVRYNPQTRFFLFHSTTDSTKYSGYGGCGVLFNTPVVFRQLITISEGEYPAGHLWIPYISCHPNYILDGWNTHYPGYYNNTYGNIHNSSCGFNPNGYVKQGVETHPVINTWINKTTKLQCGMGRYGDINRKYNICFLIK